MDRQLETTHQTSGSTRGASGWQLERRQQQIIRYHYISGLDSPGYGPGVKRWCLVQMKMMVVQVVLMMIAVPFTHSPFLLRAVVLPIFEGGSSC